MFYKLKGKLEETLPPNKLILRTGDISWEVLIPLNLMKMLKEKFLGREIELFVVPFIVKNEKIELYGFLQREEREFFLRLNALSKIGPTLALNILSVFSPEALREVIAERKIEELSKVPGIGLKRAEKLFVDLKNLFGKLSKKGITISLEKEHILSEAKACLLTLGFQKKEVEEVLFKVFQEDDTLEEVIKKALKELTPLFKEETIDKKNLS
ncbi:MAG: Holliday junction branch migration protein RuvA [Caldimicrobium sp.]